MLHGGQRKIGVDFIGVFSLGTEALHIGSTLLFHQRLQVGEEHAGMKVLLNAAHTYAAELLQLHLVLFFAVVGLYLPTQAIEVFEVRHRIKLFTQGKSVMSTAVSLAVILNFTNRTFMVASRSMA